jgi:hypothetical protein
MTLLEVSISKQTRVSLRKPVRSHFLDCLPSLTWNTELGIELGTVGFQAFYNGVNVGREFMLTFFSLLNLPVHSPHCSKLGATGNFHYGRPSFWTDHSKERK